VDLGNVSELIAAIATIATLVYVAFQIRQNTRALKSTAFHGVTDSFNQSTTPSPMMNPWHRGATGLLCCGGRPTAPRESFFSPRNMVPLVARMGRHKLRKLIRRFGDR
jgi:hypothetical protein